MISTTVLDVLFAPLYVAACLPELGAIIVLLVVCSIVAVASPRRTNARAARDHDHPRAFLVVGVEKLPAEGGAVHPTEISGRAYSATCERNNAGCTSTLA